MVYVADWRNDRVQKFDPSGQFLMSIGETGSGVGQLSRPSGVAVDADGNIYVADWENDRVQVFDPGGRFSAELLGNATMSKWGEERLSSNPENMLGQRREARSLEPEKRFVHPVSVKSTRWAGSSSWIRLATGCRSTAGDELTNPNRGSIFRGE